jgi:hypothetical protein
MVPTEQLIENLGHPDFEIREQATQRLSEREDALPAVRQATLSPDAEVRRRAAGILEKLEARKVKRLLQGTTALADAGAVDEMLERMVRWGEADAEDVGCQAALRFVDKLLERENDKEFRPYVWERMKSPLGNHADYLKTVKPTLLASPLVLVEKPGTYLIRAGEVRWAAAPKPKSLVFSTGPVRTLGLTFAVVLAGGPVEADILVGESIIVCDGDCRLGEKMAIGSVIVAHGDVYCPKTITRCAIIASGSVHFKEKSAAASNIVRENEPNAFGFVRFFDPARIGLVTDPDAKDVRLKEVRQGTPYATAGLKAGDVVLSVGGKETPDREVFRKALRRARAEGEVSFKIRRDGKTLELTAVSKD